MVIRPKSVRVKSFRSDELLEAFLKSGEVYELVAFSYLNGSPRIVYHEGKEQVQEQEIKTKKVKLGEN